MKVKKLLDWQKQAIKFGLPLENFAVLSDPGTGKTLVAIKIMEVVKKKLPQIIPVIITPNVTLYNWQSEILENTDFTEDDIYIVEGPRNMREFAVRSAIDKSKILIMGYSAIRSSYVHEKLLHWDANYRVLFIADEIQHLKNPRTSQYKVAAKLARKSAKKIFMTGTPYLTGLENIFYIYRILDSGASFGRNIYYFRGKYMYQSGMFNWIPKSDSLEKISQVLKKSSYGVSLDSCVDLPPLVEQNITVNMEGDQLRIYQDMESKLMADYKGNTLVAVNALSRLAKLLQVTSGFFVSESGETVSIEENKKMETLKHYVKEIISYKGSCIIWYSFNFELGIIKKWFASEKIPIAEIHGGINSKQKQEQIDIFNNGDADFIICQRTAGGVGINLTRANYSIVYSRMFGMGSDLQSAARNYRKGSEIHKKVVRYIFTCPDSVDDIIRQSIENHKENGEEILKLFRQQKGIS